MPVLFAQWVFSCNTRKEQKHPRSPIRIRILFFSLRVFLNSHPSKYPDFLSILIKRIIPPQYKHV
nr:MAG TPA: hypothetical protein [Caudoviricetes sp.]